MSRNLKLAIIHPFQFRVARGIERFVWEIGGALARRNVDVDLLTWRWPQTVDWGCTPEGVHIRSVPYFRYFAATAAIPYYASWLLAGRYDWAMLFFAGYGEAEAVSIARLLRPQRYCIVFHFPRDEVPHRYEEFERFGLARRAQELVAVSDYAAGGVRAQFGRECSVIGNGVDVQRFSASAALRRTVRQRLGVDSKAPVIISVAALEERKGIQWGIRAVARLIPRFPTLRYWVLGEGAYRRTLEAEIRNLGLEGHVFLLGSQGDPVSFLAASDVGCLLSHGEACGIALLEYMAMELPAVTSRHPPFDELITPASGLMVNETDAEELAATLRGLLEDEPRRRAMGMAGRRRVLEQYTWDQIADRYLELLTASSGA